MTYGRQSPMRCALWVFLKDGELQTVVRRQYDKRQNIVLFTVETKQLQVWGFHSNSFFLWKTFYKFFLLRVRTGDMKKVHILKYKYEIWVCLKVHLKQSLKVFLVDLRASKEREKKPSIAISWCMLCWWYVIYETGCMYVRMCFGIWFCIKCPDPI